MNTRRCLNIADRMNALLLHELGQGIDGLRMVAEPLYARDVLLVCDALAGTEGPELAQHFRVAATEKAQAGAAAPSPAAAGSRDRSAASSGRDRSAAPSGRDRSTAASGHSDVDARKGSRSGTAQGKDASADTGSRPSSGFGASVWSRLASGFGFSIPGGHSLPDSQPDAPPAVAGQRPARRWFSRSRGQAEK